MNPQDPLANLQPLREPAPIDWWPPAPGWWILLAIAVVVLAFGAHWLTRYRARTAYRRTALAQLDRLRREHSASGNDAQFYTELNALLKRVALTAFPGKDLAAVHGQQWLAFLNASAPGQAAFPAGFATAPYAPQDIDCNVDQLFQSAQHWIKRHEVNL